MKQDFRHAFMLGIERELFKVDSGEKQTAFFNASPLAQEYSDWKQQLICEQPFRPDYNALKEQGYETVPEIGEATFANAIVFTGRNRRLNEYNIIRARNQCEDGGLIIVAGDKNSGIGSLRKWVSQKTEVEDSFSKYHAVVFWFRKLGDDWESLDIAKSIDGYSIADGMFSNDGPDTGSKLLAEHFTKRIFGRVADFGAGWGYLSSELLKQSEKISSIDLYEADWHSLEAAKSNVKGTADLRFHWCDLTKEYKKHVLDWVVMNPPFHNGRAAEPGLGQKFIQIAASTLPSGGQLLMVANRNLPYEQTLEKTFRSFEILEVRDGFKIIQARK